MLGEESPENLWWWEQWKGGNPGQRHIFEERLPKTFILKAQPGQQTPTLETEDNSSSTPPTLFLPYVRHLSEKIQSVCRKIGVRTTFKSYETLRQLLMNMKTKTPELKKKQIVYRILVGIVKQYTSENLGGPYRNESQSIYTQWKWMTEKDGVAVHAWDNDHQPDWDAAEVVEKEPHDLKRRVLEAIWIQKMPQNCNLDCGLSLSETWTHHTH